VYSSSLRYATASRIHGRNVALTLTQVGTEIRGRSSRQIPAGQHQFPLYRISTMNYLITGGAGFIGCNLSRYILDQGHNVVVFDNFSTGHRENIADLLDRPDFTLIEGDLRDFDAVLSAMAGIDGVSHHGALASVPLSVEDPITTNEVNVNGTLHVLEAMRQQNVRRIVMACSSSAYGESPITPKHEQLPATPISPYASSKVAGEVYLQAYAAAYGVETVALRYFNIFGPRQDPEGAYAAVIPKFVTALLSGEQPTVYGDGEQTRDFCHIQNVCLANWLALNAPADQCDGQPINIGCSEQVSLNDILQTLQSLLSTAVEPIYTDERAGDVKHSLADIQRAEDTIGYRPEVYFADGLRLAIDWYKANL
jgi:nucleoside-diphosphate-sugar epimerase